MAYTQSQKKFIDSNSRFIRLLAPAGCGKTFSIIEKAKSLFTNNTKVKIAVFTFTKNAANEIRNRCDNDTCVNVFTLNSWGNNYIKTNVLKNPRIITNKDKKWYVMNSLQPVWSKSDHSAKFESLLTGRSRVKNSEKLLDLIDEFKNIGFKHIYFTRDYASNQTVYNEHLKFINKVSLTRYYDAIIREVLLLIGKKEINKSDKEKHQFIVKHWIPFWRDCCEQMLKTGSYTFDDQKYFANIELEKRLQKSPKKTGIAKIDYIFIDEFQDTSPLDISLIANLQKIHNSALVIVGDDDQAIYEFRGATPYFILHPEKIFNTKFNTFILDENFRSPGNIVNKSMSLIKHNEKRVDKNVKPVLTATNAEIKIINKKTQEQMIDAVISDIKQTLQEKDQNVAILSRLKSSLLPYQILLTKENISYSVSDDLAFFYTSAAANLNKVMDIKRKNRLSSDDLLELVCLFNKNEVYKEAKDTLARAFYANSATIDNIDKILLLLGTKNVRFVKMLTHEFITDFLTALKEFIEAKTVYATLDVLLNKFGGLQQNYSRSLEDFYYRDPPLASLLNFAEKYGNDFDVFVDDFNRAIAKATSNDSDSDILLLDEHPRIVLSTALRVKGQEYNKVIVIDTNDGIWPKQPGASQSQDEMESERRLFYVAATRAKQVLHLYRSTNIGEQKTIISPFIIEGEYDKN